jgi:NTP pyrophosphatase (non-canonical NTP hydrolase)
MEIGEFQDLIESIYGRRDRKRGLAGTFMWFVEEVGELAHAVRSGDRENLEEEFADVFAWMSTLASISGVDLESAVGKYRSGCPYCKKVPCTCPEKA